MQNNETIIKDAIEKLSTKNIIPKEKLITAMDDIKVLKKKLELLSKDELNSLLKNIPESEITKIKNQIS